ncbi:hypothetical protein [Candidatus Avelusimicrobium fimicolum]|uniref:hypothetical protein n=1 Tax=Candidatus Avelusimicrobium fimicolum TaxID=3416216 RepID=UPI003D122A1E
MPIPPKPAIQTLDQRTTPQGVRQNLHFDPMTNPAATYQQIGDNVMKLTGALVAAQEKYNDLRVQNWEEQLNNQYKEMNNKLAASQNPQEYDAIVKDTLSQMQATGKEYLGDKLFKKWEETKGNNYYAALQTDVTGQKIGLMQKLNYKTAQETTERKAYDYAYASPEEKKALDAEYGVYLETNDFTPAQKQELKTQYENQKVNGQLAYILDKDPSQIARIGTDGKVKSIMDDPEQFKTLTVAEKIEWKNRALRAQKEVEGTTKEKKINDFLTRFNQLWQDNPSQAELMYKQLLEKPADFEKATSLTAQQVKSAYSYMKDVLEQGEAGAEKQNNWADVQIKYNSLGLDSKGNFHAKQGSVEYDRPTVEQLTDLINVVDDGITVNGFGSGNRKNAIEMKRNIMHEIATQIKDDDVQLSNASGWFSSDTVSEYMKKRIKEKLEKDLHGAEIPDELAAQLYVDTFNTLRQRNVNLAATDTASKAQAKAELGVVYATLIGNRYLIDDKQVGAVLTNTGALHNVSTAKNPDAPKLKEPQGYKPEMINNVAYMVRRDKDGKIIDKYPAWMK